MKAGKAIWLLAALLLAVTNVAAQDTQEEPVYYDRIRPAWKTGRNPRGTEKQWRQYYKLVYRFPRVYPYAIAAGILTRQVDSTIAADKMGAWKREKYLMQVQKELFKDFEGSISNMSIYQGALLIKLISRETGIPPYTIIKNYKSGAAAGFWQGVARLFDNNLKASYDPYGEDKEVEELVQIWRRGEFPGLYYSVFGEYPPAVKLPEKYLKGSQSEVPPAR